MNDGALIGVEAIRKVLAAEEGDRYRRVRAEFQDREPTMSKNVKAWIGDELLFLSKKYPDWTRDELKMVAHLLERYLIRGVEIMRRAYCVDLDAQFSAPDAEKGDGPDVPEAHE